MSARKILLAAGGTGGHLFPAQALGLELQKRGWTIELATDERCDQYKFQASQIHVISSDTIRGRSPIALARTLFKLTMGYVKARKLLRKSRPDIVVGFGGYPTLPPLQAAAHMNVPTLIHEANAVLGRANRILAKQVSAIALASENTALLDGDWQAKSRIVGMPVREAVIKAAEKPYDAPNANGDIRLLIFGGSQGARIFADVLPGALGILPERLRSRLVVTQQARPEDRQQLIAGFEKLNLRAFEVENFYADMPQKIADAHLVIARSGASTVNELTVIGRPSILVPLPNAIDNDQLKNAQSLALSGAAILAEQKELNNERLGALLLNTLEDPVFMEKCARAAKSFGRPDAAILLANYVEETANSSDKSLSTTK